MAVKDFENKHFDAIIIGSGFGGAMAAHSLINAGLKVLMLERGDWVKRGPHNWALNASLDLTPFYSMESPLRVLEGGNKALMGSYSCVGGPSVFYGGVSFRFREADFSPPSEIVSDSGAEWPLTYDELEPYYTEAERLLSVAGVDGADPTEPFRSALYPQKPYELSEISKKVKRAAQSIGLNPFQMPLAINYRENGRPKCQACTTCDTFACAINAKNDLATVLLPKLQEKGLTLIPNIMVTRLNHQHGQIKSLDGIDKSTEKRFSVSGDVIILSAGAMGSPHLLLASGLPQFNPGGDVVGRYLMRHVNSIIFGIFPGRADKENIFHKQLCILDYYFGHPSIAKPSGKLGSLQQMQTPPAGLVKGMIPKPFGGLIAPGVKLLTGLLAIAEDQPQYYNRIELSADQKDRFGLAQPQVRHRYSKRDLAALKALTLPAKKILRRAGALAHYVHHIRTFSHAVGTVRMGINPKTSALDKNCQFRGIDNLYVIDGSFLPTSAAVNPSLTISANALRAGEFIGKGKHRST